MSDSVTTTATTRLLKVTRDPRVTYSLPPTTGQVVTVTPHEPTRRDAKK